jgi:cytosine/uracil/thiamine/allantoin permease
VPGFLANVSEGWKASLPPIWSDLYHYAWFISFAVSFAVYLVLMLPQRGRMKTMNSEGSTA